MVFLEVEYEKQILDDFSEHTPPKLKLIFERGEQYLLGGLSHT